jgi:sugar transferase (PEP-CTERM/EpsH1 system associated)
VRILFVTPVLPVPTTGGRTRAYNLIKQIGPRHEVHVLSFVQPAEHALVHQIEPYCERLELVPFEGFRPLGKWRNRLRGWRRTLLSPRPEYAHTFPVSELRQPLREGLGRRTFDIVLFHHLFVAELAHEFGDVGAVLAEDNVESNVAGRMRDRAANPVHWLRDWLNWRKLSAFERHWVRRFSVCVAVSDRDAAMLRQMSPSTEVYVVPNGVDSDSFAPRGDRREAESMLFFGTLSYSPNADGLIWFCQEILPRIRQSRPEVRLEVVGLNPPSRVTDLGQLPGVQVTGFVPDIRPKLWSATLCVVPLQVGGGTRLKILEALAAGCPVVSTTVGAEGLDLVEGQHLLVADDAEQFAQKTVQLLESEDLRRRLSDAGRSIVARRYDWKRIAGQLESACARAVELHTGAIAEGVCQ